jgi:hypothetical protein
MTSEQPRATPSLRGGEADEAIQGRRGAALLDCFAALAMTGAAAAGVRSPQPGES